MPQKSPLPLLADECVYKATTDYLRSLGCDVVTVQELGLAGASDDEVIDKALVLGRVLLTRDMDFSNILLYPPAQHLGIVVLKMSPETANDLHQVLEQALDQVQDIRGALLVVDRSKFRIRRLRAA